VKAQRLKAADGLLAMELESDPRLIHAVDDRRQAVCAAAKRILVRLVEGLREARVAVRVEAIVDRARSQLWHVVSIARDDRRQLTGRHARIDDLAVLRRDAP
jgi:hypothetical protein